MSTKLGVTVFIQPAILLYPPTLLMIFFGKLYAVYDRNQYEIIPVYIYVWMLCHEISIGRLILQQEGGSVESGQLSQHEGGLSLVHPSSVAKHFETLLS